MDQHLEKIFKDTMYKPGEELCDTIWCTICKKQSANNKINLLSYSLLGLVSLTSLVFVAKDILSKFNGSGFYQYVSLLSSDWSVVSNNWKEFTLSITESLPLASITISLFLLFIIFISIRKVAHKFKNQLLLA